MTQFTLTTVTDTFIGTSADETVNGTSATLNTSDQLDGGEGHDVLQLFGSGSFDLKGVAQFASFEEVTLININGGASNLTLTDSTDLDVTVQVNGGGSIHLGSGTTTLDATGNFLSFNLSSGTADLTVSGLVNTFNLADGVATIHNITGGALTDGATYNFSSGDATVYDDSYRGTFNLSSGHAIIYAGGPGSQRYELSTGDAEIHLSNGRSNVVVDDASDWHVGTILDAAVSNSNYHSISFVVNGLAVFDASDVTLLGVWDLFLGNGNVLEVSSDDLAHLHAVSGGTTAAIRTSDAILDLSSTTASVTVESGNLTGTEFIVSDATTGLRVIGGAGNDTLVGQGFAFTSGQRATIFAQGSVETIQDQSGTHQNPGATPTNSAPTISSNPVIALDEDTDHTVTAEDFNFSDINAGDQLQSVRFDSVPAMGQWLWDENGSGNAALVANGQVLSRAEIDAGHVFFRPALNANGNSYASLSYSVSDGTTFSAPGTMTFNVIPVSDAPIVTGTVSAAATEDGAPVTIDALANASDPDAGASLTLVNVPTILPAGVSQSVIAHPIALNNFAGISIPVGSNDGSSHPVNDGVYSVSSSPFPLNDALGIGYIINPSYVGSEADFALHDHAYIAPNVPDPTRAVITFQFATPTVVDQLDVVEHANGVTRLHGYVGNSLDSLTDIGAVFGNLGDITGHAVMFDGQHNVFDFNNTIAGTYFQVVIEKTSFDAGYAFFRMFPEENSSAFTLDPSNSAYQYLAAGEQVVVTFNYGVTDGTEITPASVSWTVSGVNDAPVITSGSAFSVAENSTAIGTVAAIDPDTSEAPSEFAIVDGADADKFIINASTGALSFATATDFEKPTDADGNNLYEVTVQAADANGGTNLQTVAVTVSNITGVPQTGNNNANTLTGTNEEDALNGNGGNDTLLGAGGNDTLIGGAGNDTLNGEVGRDVMSGGIGNDTYLVDETGDDVIESANEGTDVVQATLNTYTLTANVETLTFTGVGDFAGAGNERNNRINGAGGGDTLGGGVGDDTLTGNAGNDILVGGDGNDSLVGGADNDTLSGGLGNDTLNGGAGTDTATYAGENDAMLVDLGAGNARRTSAAPAIEDTLAGIENVIGGSGSDTITGNGSANSLSGSSGDDTLQGAGGADILAGGDGDDLLTGGTGNDSMSGGGGNDIFVYTLGDGADSINGGEGADTDTLNVTGTNGNDTLDVHFDGSGLTQFEGGTLADLDAVNATLLGGTDNLTYAGTTAGVSINLGLNSASGFASVSGIDNVTGGLGNDALTGDGNANTLTGGAGNDTLNGNGGVDNLVGGTGDDTYITDSSASLTEGANAGTDTVLSTATISLGNNFENLTLLGSGNINGTGNATNNVIIGNDGNNTLSGGAGVDTLLGGVGDDTVVGGTGTDVMTGGFGNDTFVFNALNESGVGVNNSDLVADFDGAGLVGGDIINLAAIDAINGGVDQAFTLLSGIGASFTAAGQLRIVQQGGDTFIQANTNANTSNIEFELRLLGSHTLVAGDFGL